MAKSKEQIQKDYEKRLAAKLKEIEKTQVNALKWEDTVKAMTTSIRDLMQNEIISDYKHNKDDTVAVSDIFSMIDEGWSFDMIIHHINPKNLEITDYVREIYAAGLVRKESLEKTKQRLAESLQKIQIQPINEEEIRGLCKQNGIPIKPENNNKQASDSEYRKNAIREIINRKFMRADYDRVLGNYLLNPAFKAVQRQEIKKQSRTKKGMQEIIADIVSEIVNTDYESFMKMSDEELMKHYAEFYYARNLVLDTNLFGSHKAELDGIPLSAEAQNNLKEYVNGIQTIMAGIESRMPLIANPVSEIIDWEKINKDEEWFNIHGKNEDIDHFSELECKYRLGLSDAKFIEQTKEYLKKFNAEYKFHAKAPASYQKFRAHNVTLLNQVRDMLKEQDAETLTYRLNKDFVVTNPKQSYDDFCEILDTDTNLTDKEIAERRELTELAIKNVVRAEDDHSKRLPPEIINSKICRTRTFMDFMLCHDPSKSSEQCFAENNKVIDAFESNDKEKMKEAVEARFNYLLGKKDLLTRSYTDRELVENWPKLYETIRSAGMEYINFKSLVLKGQGFQIDEDLMRKMDDFCDLAANFNNYYQNRMDYICTQYYQYGAEDILGTKGMSLNTLGDFELQRTGFAYTVVFNNQRVGLGAQFIHDRMAEGKTVKAVYDEYMRPVGIGDYDIGEMIAEGKTFFVSYNESDPDTYEMCCSVNGNTFPPELTTKALSKDEVSLDLRNSILEKYEKHIQSVLSKENFSQLESTQAGQKIQSALSDVSRAMVDVLEQELKINPTSKQIDRMYNWIGNGKSLNDIKAAGFIDDKNILDSIDLVYDCLKRQIDDFEVLKKRARESLKAATIKDELSREQIEDLKSLGLPLHNPPLEKDQKAIELFINNQIEAGINRSFGPITTDRVFANLFQNPNLSEKAKFALADKQFDDKGKQELYQMLVNEILSTDYAKWLSASDEYINQHYAEFEYARLIVFDNKFMDAALGPKSFMNETDYGKLNTICQNLQLAINRKKAQEDLDINAVSRYFDWRKVPDRTKFVLDFQNYHMSWLAYFAPEFYGEARFRISGEKLDETFKTFDSLNHRHPINSEADDASYKEFLDNVFSLGVKLPSLLSVNDPQRLAAKLKADLVDANPKLSYDLFCSQLGIDVKDRISTKEMLDRAELTRMGIESTMKSVIDYNSCSKFDKDVYSLDVSQRVFGRTMFSRGAEHAAENEQICKDFDVLTKLSKTKNPDKKTQKDLAQSKAKATEDITNRFKYLVSKKNIVEKQYTDAELIKNWSDIQEIIQFGMEYKTFSNAMEKSWGIKLDETLQADMDDLFKQTVQFTNRYGKRMDYICTQYFKYGGEEQLQQQGREMVEDADRALAQTAKHCSGIFDTNTKYFNDVKDAFIKNLDPKREQMLMSILDEDLNEIPLDGPGIGKALDSGKQIIAVYKDAHIPQIFQGKAGKFPVQIENISVTEKIREDAILKKYNLRMDAIEKSNGSEAIKAMDHSILAHQFAVSDFIHKAFKADGQNDPQYREKMTGMVSDLMARVTIKEMCKKIPEDNDEMISQLNSRENIKKFADDLKRTGVATRIASHMPKTMGGVLNMSIDDLYKEIVNEVQKRAEDKQQDAPQKQAQINKQV